MTITDVRVRKVAKDGKMKAVVSITLDEAFVVHDIKVIEGQNGLFIAMKANIEEEIENSTEILKKLDSNIEKIETFYLPIENSIRNIIMIQKQIMEYN